MQSSFHAAIVHRVRFIVLNAVLKSIKWWSVVLVAETVVRKENNRPVAIP